MDVTELVRRHYGGDDLEGSILAAMAAAGIDPDAITVADLAAIDQLHAGFVGATRYLLERLDLTPESRLLDVGSGIGGPARVAAAQFGCHVVGVDLSPDFVRTAEALTTRVGLNGLVEFRAGSAADSGLTDASFDRAMIIHVGMNIPDKAAVFAEVARLLEPGGLFGVYEQMRVGDGALPYPMPWAVDEQSSFVSTPDEYARDLAAAGLTVAATEDRTAATAAPAGPGAPSDPPSPPGPLSPAAVFGPEFVRRISNNIAATRAGLLAPVLIIARKDPA